MIPFAVDLGLIGIGGISSWEALKYKEGLVYKDLGLALLNYHRKPSKATIKHLQTIHGKKVVKETVNKPLWYLTRGHLRSAVRKSSAIGMLILMHEIVPNVSSMDVIPGHDLITELFFKTIEPLSGREILNTLTRYHVIDLMPLMMKVLNILADYLSIRTNGKNNWIEVFRTRSEQACRLVESVWWIRISLIVIAAGKGSNIVLSSVLLALLNRFLPIEYFYPSVTLGNAGLRGSLARLFAFAGSISAVMAGLFHTRVVWDLGVLDSCVRKSNEISVSFEKELKSDKKTELQKLFETISSKRYEKKLTRSDARLLKSNLTKHLAEDYRRNKKAISPLLTRRNWSKGTWTYDLLAKYDKPIFKEISQHASAKGEA